MGFIQTKWGFILLHVILVGPKGGFSYGSAGAQIYFGIHDVHS